MTTADLRLVGVWTALSVAAHALIFAFSSISWLRDGYAVTLLTTFAMAAAPVAQAIALRTAGIRWARDWAVAGIAGALIARVLLDVLLKTGVNAASMFLYMFASVAAVLALQVVVLRRHAAGSMAWVAASAAVWAMQLAVHQVLTGSIVPGPRTAPLSPMTMLGVTAATALLTGVVLVWFVLRSVPSSETRSPRSAGAGWVWVEWTSGAAVALLIVMGTAGLLETAFRTSPRTGFTVGRPVFAAVAGLVIGGIQWLLLRRRIALPRAWLVVSVAALATPALLTNVPALGMFVLTSWLTLTGMPGGLAVLGAWFGFCQWLVLRRYANRASVWIPATAIAWSLHYFTIYPYRLSLETVGLAAGATMVMAMLALREPPGDDVRLAPSVAPQT